MFNPGEPMIPPDEQEKEVNKLPPGARDAVRDLIRKMQALPGFGGVQIHKIDVNALTTEGHDHDEDGNCSPDREAELADKKPIRSYKLTPRCLKLLKEANAWAKSAQREAEKIGKEAQALKKRNDALREETSVWKDDLYALINVEMGLNSRRFSMRVNSETEEVEILEDNRPEQPMPEPVKASRKMSGKKKRV